MLRLAFAFVLAIASSGCGSQTCTRIGCLSSATFIKDNALGGDVTVRLCRAGACSEGTVAAGVIGVELPGVLRVVVDNDTSADRITITFGGTWVTTGQIWMDDLADGETITVAIKGSGVSVDTTRVMTYAHSLPNGKQCVPECRSATVTL